MELFHVFNRGVEKRDIFLDDHDRFRFVHGLGLFNTKAAANNTTYLLDRHYNDIVSRYLGKRIVDIHAWCLMKNHYHLLLSERTEGGISSFTRKLNIGYAKYFNKRYGRTGYLFQGRTKKIHVDSERYFLHIANYVHFNPLDYSSSGRDWRERHIEKPDQAHEYLLKYRWSSYRDYCGERNFPAIITTHLIGEPTARFRKRILDYAGDADSKLPHQFLLE